MEGLAIVFAIPILIITMIMFVGTIVRLIRSFKHQYEPMIRPTPDNPNRVHPLSTFNHKIAPLIISILAPISGFAISYSANPHTKYDDVFYTPLNHDHMLTILVFYIISVIAFWMSRTNNNQYSPIIRTLVLLGMAEGFLLCIFLSIHFGEFLLLGFFPILITFPLLSPLLFAMLLFIEIRRQFHEFKKTHEEKDIVYDSFILSNADNIIKSDAIENPLWFFLLIPFIAIQQAILILFGQQPDSFIKAFAETCTYTFSQFDPPPDPGGHYLCTIASRGNPNLVKPIRKGIRGGKVIDVNRQLLISNAFEEWLEQHSPIFHRYLRGFYNRVGRPLNNWVQSPSISNMMFIIMKPLEWFFILWLYLVDEKPENRIFRQYLPNKHK